MKMLSLSRKLAKEVEYYSHLAYERYLVRAAGGNISVRIPGEEKLLITPTGVSLRDVRANKLVCIDMSGKKIEGPEGFLPSKEWNLHIAVYKCCPYANAVFHIHPPYATIFAVLKEPFLLPTSQARIKIGQVLIAEYADPGTSELAERVKEIIQRPSFTGNAILLRDHGLITWAKDSASAFDTAELIEETAIVSVHSELLKGLKLLTVNGTLK